MILRQFKNLNAIRKNFSHIPQPRKGFVNELFDSIKDELTKNKEMNENLRKFREEASKLENSEALNQVRQKYQKLERETLDSSSQLREQLESLRSRLRETLNDSQKSEFTKKAIELSEEIAKQAKSAAELASKAGQSLGSTEVYKALTESVKLLKDEIENQTSMHNMHYTPLIKLRKRKEDLANEQRIIPTNTDATDVVMHKESRWYQSWQNWKDNNPYINKMFDLKAKYDESDSILIRASRFITDKVSNAVGGIFSNTELSDVLTEITKMDPLFDKETFLRDCRTDIVPNILEAMLQGNLEILNDWCHEAPYNVLSTPIKQAYGLGYHFESKLIDISPIELSSGKILEQGPVLVIHFNTQQIMCIKDNKGNVIEGDPDKVMRMQYVWILCKDMTELNPKASWKLLDLSIQAFNQWA